MCSFCLSVERDSSVHCTRYSFAVDFDLLPHVAKYGVGKLVSSWRTVVCQVLYNSVVACLCLQRVSCYLAHLTPPSCCNSHHRCWWMCTIYCCLLSKVLGPGRVRWFDLVIGEAIRCLILSFMLCTFGIYFILQICVLAYSSVVLLWAPCKPTTKLKQTTPQSWIQILDIILFLLFLTFW